MTEPECAELLSCAIRGWDNGPLGEINVRPYAPFLADAGYHGRVAPGI